MNAKLSAAELEVMRHVWAAGEPVTCEALRASLAGEREWKTTTVLTFLSRLADKGMLTVTKRGRANLAAEEAKTVADALLEGASRRETGHRDDITIAVLRLDRRD